MADSDDWQQDNRPKKTEGFGLEERPQPDKRVVSLNDHRHLVEMQFEGRTPKPSLDIIRVLIVEDDEDDFIITRELLQRSEEAQYSIEWASCVDSGLKRLAAGGFDICLVDYQLPDSTGLDLVQAAQRRGFELPMILVSGMAEEQVDISALDFGVEDFIDKEEFDVGRLDRAIRFALARRKAITRFGRLAQHDDLTGLVNRALFRNRLDRALATARRRRSKVAVMMMNINGFRDLNEQYGHQACDKFLTIIGERLTGRLRETDTIARMVGDEFALVIEDLSKPEFAGIVARKILDALAPPIVFEDNTAPIDSALGVSIFPDDAREPEELVHLADAAMYEAKRAGGHRCRFHDPAFDSRMRHGALIGKDLRRAIETDQISLLFQPQVTLASPDLGLASIIQWEHPDLGPVGLDHFKILAEDTGSVEPLISWLIDQACTIAKRWHLKGYGPLHVAIPIMSRRQLSWSNLASRISALLRTHELPASWIELEIDESLLLEEIRSGGEAFSMLKASGVRLAVSGFGAGPTSLVVLRDTPLSTIKLARSLLKNCPEDKHRTMFASSVVALGKQLGLRVVAEGAENQQQLHMLKSQACDAVQSVMSCPPLPFDACTKWLARAGNRLDFNDRDPSSKSPFASV